MAEKYNPRGVDAFGLEAHPRRLHSRQAIGLQVIDQAGDVAGAEAVVDVDDRHAGRAAVQHARAAPRCRRSSRRSRPTSARRSPARDTSPATTLGSAPSMPATTMMTRAASRRALLAEQAVEAGDADVVEPLDVVAHQLSGAAPPPRRPAGPRCRRRRRGCVPLPGATSPLRKRMMPRVGVIDGVGHDARARRRTPPAWRASRAASIRGPTISAAMAAICAGVLPRPSTTSGKPCRTRSMVIDAGEPQVFERLRAKRRRAAAARRRRVSISPAGDARRATFAVVRHSLCCDRHGVGCLTFSGTVA